MIHILYLLPFIFAQQDGCNTALDSSSIAGFYSSSDLGTPCPDDTEADLNFCFTNGSSSTSVPYAGITLNGAFVIRSIVIKPISSLNIPSSFKIEAIDSAQTGYWYVNPGDQADGSSWTLLQSAQVFSSDFDVSEFQFYPVTTVTTADQPLGFGLSVQGCKDSETAMASMTFQSSIETITNRFSSTATFLTELQKQVCKMLSLASTCRQVIPSSIQEVDQDWSSGTPVAPQLTVKFRILPPATSCSNCASANSLLSQLQSDLSDATTVAAQVMVALQSWVQDDTPFMCAGKTCPFGTQCFSGVCIDPSTVTVAAIASSQNLSTYDAPQALTLQNLAVDQVLTLPQLALINGAPVPTNSLQFTSGNTSDSQSVQVTKSQSTLIIVYASVGGAAAVIICGLVWFLYFRH